ncbi:MAG: LacI family DNA-binding transcriptional regulator [Actinomycetota bacterium]|nr:LacI family DNA-binding transcriptional regulator [Actinomycetota bacterium]
MSKKSKSPSIRDIAKEAGVAISTVSYVVNNKDLVADDTKKKVLKAVDKLGYKPNFIARSLRTRKTNTVGVIVYDISNPFVAQIVRGMEEIVKTRSYIMVLGCTFNNASEEERQINVMVNQFIDGLLIVSGSDNENIYKKILAKKLPLVFVDRELEKLPSTSIIIDNALAMEKAVDYLFSMGHRQIGYISYPMGKQTTIKQRYSGYVRGLEKNNLAYNSDYVIMDEKFTDKELEGKDMDITFKLMQDFIKTRKLPTAFITISDIIAYGLIKALKDNNIKVPDDVSVIGFDNIMFDDYMSPPLTTVKQPKKMMGITGMNLLLDIIEGKNTENKRIILPTEIIKRQSVKSIPLN